MQGAKEECGLREWSKRRVCPAHAREWGSTKVTLAVCLTFSHLITRSCSIWSHMAETFTVYEA